MVGLFINTLPVRVAVEPELEVVQLMRYVQQQLIVARDAGAAVLLISDDLDEVLMLGDRIAVMHAGRLSDARPAPEWSRETIGLAMTGGVAGDGSGMGEGAADSSREKQAAG